MMVSYVFIKMKWRFKEKLLLMAQNSNMVKFSEIDDNDYLTLTDSVQYDMVRQTKYIVQRQ